MSKELVPTNLGFTLSNIAERRTELEASIAKLDQRLETLDESSETESGMRVLKPILSLSHDKAWLKKLAKVIDRAADIVQHQDDLKAKIGFCKTAESDPAFAIWTLGDINGLVDNAEQQFEMLLGHDNDDPTSTEQG